MKREAEGAGLKNLTELDSLNRRDNREKKLTEEISEKNVGEASKPRFFYISGGLSVFFGVLRCLISLRLLYRDWEVPPTTKSLCQKPSFCVIARSGATKQSYNVLKIRRLPRTLRVLAMTKMGFGTASLWEREGNFPQRGDREKMHSIFYRKTRFGYWMGLGKIKGEVKLGFGTWNLVFLCQDELY